MSRASLAARMDPLREFPRLSSGTDRQPQVGRYLCPNIETNTRNKEVPSGFTIVVMCRNRFPWFRVAKGTRVHLGTSGGQRRRGAASYDLVERR